MTSIPEYTERLRQAVEAERTFNAKEYSAKINATNYISPTDADISEAGPQFSNAEYRQYWDNKFEELTKPLPVMEVEEIEVINIELSDYPLPENVTTYDWWWA